MRHVYYSRVKEVYEHYREVNHRKDDNGKMTFDRVPNGWWVVTRDNISYPMGSEKPEIAVGDTVKISIERSTP
jgi:hypothetical protein